MAPSSTHQEHPAATRLDQFIRSKRPLRWLFLTKEDHVVIAQTPNAPLIIAIAADIAAYLARGDLKTIATWTAQTFFAVWAISEIGWGVNPFRRILGALVIGFVGFALFRRLM